MSPAALAARHLLAEHRTVTAPASPPVAGYAAWYDAAQIVGQADNTALATWPDLSGNGHDLTTATSSPTYYKTTSAKLVNGKPAVWFASLNQLSTSITLNQPLTFAAVWATTSTAAYQYVLQSTAGPTIAFGVGSSRDYSQYAGGWLYSSTVMPADGTAHVEIGIFNSTVSAVYADGAQVVTGDAGPAGGTDIRIGSGQPIVGPVCEILVYLTALTSPQITSIYNYLKAKWGTP